MFNLVLLDTDECSNGDNNCDTNAQCDNTVGSYSCTCNAGYSGNGETCTGRYSYKQGFTLRRLMYISKFVSLHT